MLKIHPTKRDGHPVLKLSGELNIYAVSEAKRELTAKLDKHPNTTLDLSDIEELDTAGVQLLFWLRREAQLHGQDLPLIHHSEAVVQVFDLLKIGGTFGDPIFISPSDAREDGHGSR